MNEKVKAQNYDIHSSNKITPAVLLNLCILLVISVHSTYIMAQTIILIITLVYDHFKHVQAQDCNKFHWLTLCDDYILSQTRQDKAFKLPFGSLPITL